MLTGRESVIQALGIKNVNKQVLMQILAKHKMNNINDFAALITEANKKSRGFDAKHLSKLKEQVLLIIEEYPVALKKYEDAVQRRHKLVLANVNKQDLAMRKIIRDLEVLSEKYVDTIGAETGVSGKRIDENPFLVDAMLSIVKHIRSPRTREDGSCWLCAPRTINI